MRRIIFGFAVLAFVGVSQASFATTIQESSFECRADRIRYFGDEQYNKKHPHTHTKWDDRDRSLAATDMTASGKTIAEAIEGARVLAYDAFVDIVESERTPHQQCSRGECAGPKITETVNGFGIEKMICRRVIVLNSKGKSVLNTLYSNDLEVPYQPINYMQGERKYEW